MVLGEWLEGVKDFSAEKIRARCPHPFLLASPHETAADPSAKTLVGGFTYMARLPEGRLSEENAHSLLECLVYPVAKRAGANLDPMITLGRGLKNDVVLDSRSISKFHAVLFGFGDEWFVRDTNSRNGTFVGERELEPEVSTPLPDWSRFRFARVEGRFVLPETMLKIRSLLGRAE